MTELESIKQTFNQNITSVDRLVNFDREVQDFTIKNVEELHNNLKSPPLSITNTNLNGERTLKLLRDVRQNDSLRGRYETIFNQAIVLLVSYFGSAVSDILRSAISKGMEIKNNKRLLEEELHISVEEIVDASQDFLEAVPELIILKKDISFQDMWRGSNLGLCY